MWILIWLLVWLGDPQTLVMSNGQVLQVDRYEKGTRQVTIHKDGQVFSLPVNAVDWERTEAQAQYAEAARQEALKMAAAELRGSAREKPEPRKPIVLTNDNFQRSTPALEATSVPYRTHGNSILVSVVINGEGPFDILLDTGASITTIDPDVLASLRIKDTGRSIALGGVGGMVASRLVEITEISLGQARVHDLEVAAHRIPELQTISVIGLLGQDFLNHFVMELDSNARMVRLTPHGSGKPSSAATTQADLMEYQQRYRTVTQQLHRAMQRLDRLTGQYFAGVGRQDNAQAREIATIIDEVDEMRRFMHDLHGLIRGVKDDFSGADQNSNLQEFLSCHIHYDRILRDTMTFCQNLRRAYAQPGNESQTEKTAQQLRDKLTDVRQRYQDLLNCVENH